MKISDTLLAKAFGKLQFVDFYYQIDDRTRLINIVAKFPQQNIQL
jgi:hypothetical protein